MDVLEVSSNNDHQYDLPLHYKGQVTHVSHPLEASTTSMSALGDKNGYQHLWLRARAQVNEGELFQLTWLLNNRFYTYSVLADKDMEVLFTQTGANDPNFNLRIEPGLILRVKAASKHKFISVLEPHGEYNGSREFTTASASHIKSIKQFPRDSAEAIGVYGKTHTLEAAGKSLQWTGSHRLFKEEKTHE